MHKGGASDEVYAAEFPNTPVPRVGEYVSVGNVVSAFVYGVDHDLGWDGDKREVKVTLVCDGTPERCTWNCDKEYYREQVDYIHNQ
jgi:hypothetical protein